jgi:hypothetical protein
MRRGSYALAAYAVITLVMTWPLARGLTRDVAWDLGDSVLNMWILAWDGEQFRAILTGHFSHLRTFFDANIFHPSPLTLAYSEHLVPQALQIFPIYVLTGNPILGYNLLFLSTFVLSGLGMYLFLREVTGNAIAAFVGGLLFAFAPYRIPQSSHLQVLSSQWMPFAFYGLRRYFDTARRRALAGAAAAVIAENLSCGYYLLYFPPFVAAYVVWEMWRGDRWRDRPHLDRPFGRRSRRRGRDDSVRDSVHPRVGGAAAFALADGSDSTFGGRLLVWHGLRGRARVGGTASRMSFQKPRASCFLGLSPRSSPSSGCCGEPQQRPPNPIGFAPRQPTILVGAYGWCPHLASSP